MLFDGKLDAVDLMAIKHEEEKLRQKKLEFLVHTIRECDEGTIDITPLCDNLGIELTAEEFNWIIEQVQED